MWGGWEWVLSVSKLILVWKFHFDATSPVKLIYPEFQHLCGSGITAIGHKRTKLTRLSPCKKYYHAHTDEKVVNQPVSPGVSHRIIPQAQQPCICSPTFPFVQIWSSGERTSEGQSPSSHLAQVTEEFYSSVSMPSSTVQVMDGESRPLPPPRP